MTRPFSFSEVPGLLMKRYILIISIKIPQRSSSLLRMRFMQKKIARLESRLKLQTVKYSEMKPEYLAKSQVFILDTIGYLGKSYSYADIAYVGGAAGNTGLHNVLEPATFGIPIITGEHIQKFPEALQLEKLAGLFKVSTASEFEKIAGKLLTDIEFRQKQE